MTAKPAPEKGPGPAQRGMAMVLGLIWTGIVLVNFALGDFAMAALWAGVGVATTVPIVASSAGLGRRAKLGRDGSGNEPS